MFQTNATAFTQGLYIDALRGDDATGICVIDKDGSADVLKDAEDSNYFIGYSEYNKLLDKAVKSGKAILGHNRKATVGKVVEENSHPFVTGDDFIFFHNGSLNQWRHWGYNAEVDSDALGQHIRKAIREDKPLGDALGEVSGAYACVWYDVLKEEVCIVRNSQRPMYIVDTPNGYFYGSELEMLYLICARNNQKVESSAEVPVDTLVSFDLRADYSALKPKLRKLEIKKYTPPVVTRPTGGKKRHGKANSAATKQSSEVSKSAFKRWLKTCVGEYCSFWCESWEKVENPVGSLNYRIYGEVDDETDDGVSQYTVEAYVKAESEDEVFEWYDKLVSGNIITGRLTDDKEVVLTVSSPKIVRNTQSTTSSKTCH